MLVDYNSSSDEAEEPSEGGKTMNTMVPAPIKRIQLPKATALLGVKKSRLDDDTQEADDRAKHAGRIRSFKHERGNWATYVYIPIEDELVEDLQTMIIHEFSDILQLQLPTDALHISLSKTVVLQYHLIDGFVDSLEQLLRHCSHFSVSFLHLKIYTNEERTRTFIALQIDAAFEAKLKELLEKIDGVMLDYRLPVFYEKPSFHVSILWCLGDQTELLNSHFTKLTELLNSQKAQESHDLNVKEICCKSGNKQFTFKLD